MINLGEIPKNYWGKQTYKGEKQVSKSQRFVLYFF